MTIEETEVLFVAGISLLSTGIITNLYYVEESNISLLKKICRWTKQRHQIIGFSDIYDIYIIHIFLCIIICVIHICICVCYICVALQYCTILYKYIYHIKIVREIIKLYTHEFILKEIIDSYL